VIDQVRGEPELIRLRTTKDPAPRRPPAQNSPPLRAALRPKIPPRSAPPSGLGCKDPAPLEDAAGELPLEGDTGDRP
jgi:hypothetical protein